MDKITISINTDDVLSALNESTHNMYATTGEGWYEGGTVYLFWVKPPWGAFGLAVHLKNISMLQWCEESFGPHLDWSHKNRRWFANNQKFYFRNEHDRMLFLLRWA